MSHPWQTTQRRLLDMLADRATFGLTRREEKEFRQMIENNPDFDTECIDRAAATAHLAFVSVELMPLAVRTRIRASGKRYVSMSPPQ